MRRYALLLLLAGVWAASASCSPGIAGVTCSTHSDCEKNSRCDTEKGICIATPPCRDDSACGAGMVCRNAVCVPRTTECTPACEGLTECLAGSCVRSFASLSIEAPLSGTNVGSAFTLRAGLVRTAEGAATPPSALLVTATPSGGGASTTLPNLPNTTGLTYETATAQLPGQGSYVVTVSAGDPRFPDLVDTVELTVVSAPTIALFVKTPPGRPVPADPTPGFEAAYLKSERAEIQVYSDDASVTSAHLEASLEGGVPFAIPFSGSCTGHVFCRIATPDLDDWTLHALRGRFRLVAVGSTSSSIQGASAPAELAVTRLKWLYDLGSGAVPTAPAIGAAGRVYVGTRGTGGAVHLVQPGGTGRRLYESGPVALPVAVAAAGPLGAPDILAVAVAGDANTGAGSGLRLVMDSVNGAVVTSCDAPDGQTRVQGMAVVQAGVGQALAAIVENAAEQAGFITLVPGAMQPCTHQAGVLEAGIPPGGGLIASGSTLYWADADGNLQTGTFNPTSGSVTRPQTTGWPVILAGAPVAPILALGSVYAASSTDSAGQLLRASVDGCASGSCPQMPVSGAVGSILEAPAGAVAAARPTGLLVATSAFEDKVEIPLRGGVAASPALGKGGLIYAVGAGGELHVIDPVARARVWGTALDAPALTWAPAAPALDCGRDASGVALADRPGTLYLATTSGKLAAIVVDSRGLDTGSGWPKLQHDPHNSGNAGLALSEFACP